MNKLRYSILSLLLLPIINLPLKAVAHSSKIQYRQTTAIQIQAIYGDGQPMTNAQVTIYAPNEPAIPWLQSTTNEQGEFIFVPDREQLGNWLLKVRQAGHGATINIPLAEAKKVEEEIISEHHEITEKEIQAIEINTEEPKLVIPQAKNASWSTSKNSEYSALQKLVMAATGVWGFVGTALFFSRSKTEL